jgi:hypothetical protein
MKKIIKTHNNKLPIREGGAVYSAQDQFSNTVPASVISGVSDYHSDITDIHTIVKNRYLRALDAQIKKPDSHTLKEIASESTDDAVLLRVAASHILDEPSVSNEARAFVMAQEIKKEMRDYRGGSIKAVEVASILNIGRQTVNDRRKRHELLGLKLGLNSGNGYLYPIWQFFTATKTRKAFASALKSMFKRGMDEWMIVGFFMGDNDYLSANCPDYPNPIDALIAGECEVVKKASAVYMQHGAA